MRKVIYAMNMSIDGCVDYTQLSPPDEEVSAYFNDLMFGAGLIAYGRKTYEIMFPYWADEANWDTELDTQFGQRLTAVGKIVFSLTLESADYNTRVVNTDPVEELRKLKQASGGDILLSTVSMVPLFAQAGLIDEYRFVVQPALVGQGARLVEDGNLAKKLNLKLVDSIVFKSGCVALKYVKS
jgi:dihydrofolate reductase